ncbi:tumor susceptibility gene 101 protein-like [Babylonia areolata]|uniref:tumor susceptibility gene 101 protein-like n=1 Tax=Babylonia areolata TaxID=304850 RepID=UPI003FD12522
MSNFDSVLKNYFSTYKNAEAAKRDVSQTLQHYRDLRPSVEPFVFNDGSTQRLVQLEGTIPVPYKGNTYNIPIQLWVMDSHPYNPPIVYVRPTSTMQIRSGRYVDMNGKVDLPYLREWRWPSSDLMGLVQILIVTFGEECPVFSKVPARPPPPNMAQTPYPTGPGHMPMPGMPQPGQGTQPPYPSYPGPGYPQQPGSYPPAQPPYPPTTSQSSTGYPQQGGYPPSTSSYPSSQPPSQYPHQYGGYGSNPPYPAGQMAYSATQGTAAPAPSTTRPSTGTVTEEHIRASLLSAVEDKMKRRLREFFAQAQAEMDVLKKTQTDLTKGKEKLEQMLRDLEQEKTNIESNMILLSTKDQEVKEALQRMEQQEKVDIDEAVVTTAPLYRQLIDAFAEEQAIEDAIYYLGEALRKNVIELEVFLKRVRELSRKQFMQRALIQKCREKAGLPPLV